MTKQQSKSDLIWNKIKDLDLGLFALPGQKVSKLFQRVEVEPEAVYLKTKVPAALAALDEAVEGKKISKDQTLNIEQTLKFTIVKIIES